MAVRRLYGLPFGYQVWVEDGRYLVDWFGLEQWFDTYEDAIDWIAAQIIRSVRPTVH